ncbi:Pls/PosA family non-ribosomal peptide synthetase [Yoonia sediminilitoris]|uniref:Non-ribosomal peptide synthetase-like protein n=1 Tax=Yoonia sediminilitoris TaxID=1286148 RepID=A0A2T6KLN8_9RHOB|nr:Pls/PosA family non-ribosomal peptide synthetase [Yoonia sediminilitoris]PUB17104.1 non-ribosomal peptide synthetase-like protein [Yoonia sediminilitoris]RCW97399.1 non-ribosomal peptide synthetase-like protein [Yoonia sediminilitoris]
MLVSREFDNAVRWMEGQRLDQLFEARCDAVHASQTTANTTAVISDTGTLSFRELDNRANQLARYLLVNGIGSGDRVGLLFDKSAETYIALLAVLKVNAAYVPLDAGFPTERISFILKDAGVKALVSQEVFRPKLDGYSIKTLYTDTDASLIARQSTARLDGMERGDPTDQLCYIIYTSGTTGNPKGVPIEHASICNFVSVAAQVYGIAPDDRVYQGMTIAFDFSVEELWVPLIAGAALVPGKPGTSLVGEELAQFLSEREVTVLCCVPTLLATIERDLPKLRILLLSGEACPPNLVQRWYKPGRNILNAYGPTEATVTATLAKLYPGKPVTIGTPLPTYTVVILDADEDKAVPEGEMGEICIAGIGLAQGYLNRPNLTHSKFIRDFLQMPNNPSGRIYRTGDLGRITEDGEVEFHGRIDTQVKIRGYRIELAEIETVLMNLPHVAQAIVDTHEIEPGQIELVGYYTPKKDVELMPDADIAAFLRSYLPAYMMPAFLERLDAIPMTPSNKADRKALPAPTGPRLAAGRGAFVAPQTDIEKRLSAILSDILRLDRVSVDDNFFLDLGGHSMLMARFCSEVRKDLRRSDVAMTDTYLHPTVRLLAEHLAEREETEQTRVATPALRYVPSRLQYVGCGTLQLLTYLGSGLFGLWFFSVTVPWVYAVIDDPLAFYGRFVGFGVATFLMWSAIPVIAKWMLIGKWQKTRIPIWSLAYFRFWFVSGMIRSAPPVLFAGTEIYNTYLRLLGAKIGKGAVLLPKVKPVCTDLFHVGSNSILRNDVVLSGFAARNNYIHIGPIDIGDDAYVGSGSVIDIDTVIEDGAQLGHASSMQSGQRLRAGKSYHGSPSIEAKTAYNTVGRQPCSSLRRWSYALFRLGITFGMFLPAFAFVIFMVWDAARSMAGVSFMETGADISTVVTAASVFALITTFVGLGLLVARLAWAFAVPRLLNPFLEERKVYPLFGVHYFLHDLIRRATATPFFTVLFGDSVMITTFQKLAGYNLNDVIQTGSNFGLEHKHDDPLLCDIGSGTMVSDGLVMVNTEMSSSGFRRRTVAIGPNNYLGNAIVFPPGGKVGENCLLATKVMIPTDGPLHANVGLLGSPAFEIPRAAKRDQSQSQDFAPSELKDRLRRKTAHNIGTLLAFVVINWAIVCVTIGSLGMSILFYPQYGLAALVAASLFASVAGVAYFVLVEWLSLGFKRLQPQAVSMYEPYFWFHERHWKLSSTPLTRLFAGTPFKNIVSRLLGVRVGKMVFDGGAAFVEKTMIEVGDYTNLNTGCVLQGHSLEEGYFKSDRIRIGKSCTLGPSAFVHYGVNMGDDVTLGPDSFLMKGETLEARTTWCGNPARRVDHRKTVVVEPMPRKLEPMTPRRVAAREAQPVDVHAALRRHQGI